MIKSHHKVLFMLMMAAFVLPASLQAQFTGPYVQENWTFTSQDLSGQTADGSIDLTNMPTGFTIAGNNDGLSGANSRYTITIPEDGTVKFKWSYFTNDGPFYDKAGYLLNGVFFELTDPNSEEQEANGEESVVVAAGDTFAFIVDATDACCGRGFFTVERFSTADNTAPTLNSLGNIFSDVNPGEIIVNLEGISAGIDETDQSITITASSNNTAVIPNPTVTYTSPESIGTLTFTPVTDAFGDAVITINVADDGGTANGSVDNIDVTFTVSIAGNLPPSIDVISDIESRVNQVLSVDLTGIDAGGAETQNITITATSSNQAVVANEDIVVNYTSPNATGTLDITPVVNASGESIIEVTVADDGGTANNGKNSTTTFFSITVAPNGQPVINEIADVNLFDNSEEQVINLNGIGDGDGGVDQTVTITASSSNPLLIPSPGVTYTSPDATGTLSINPVADQIGTSTITVTVTDNAGTNNGGLNETSFTFLVTVLGNFQPEISPLGNIQIGINEPNRVIDLGGISGGVISNEETIAVSASSSNAEVIDPATIEVNYTSPEATGNITFSPVVDAIGESTITVTVMDDGGTANGGIDAIQETFVVRVIANRAPTINEVNDLGLDINADVQTVNINGITSGEDSDYQTLTVTATSDNTALIPNPDVTYTSAETGGSISFTPVADATGTANITVTVSDDGGTLEGGVNSTSITFEVSVSGNQAPTMNEIQDVFRQSIDAFSVNLSGISDGTGLVQNLTIAAASDNPTIIPNPTVNYTGGSNTGSLDFAPTAFGDAAITVTIVDDGGTANGGVDTFTQTFNVRLGGNQPPSIEEFGEDEGNLDGATFLFNNGQGDQALVFNVFDNSDEGDDDNIISVTVTSTNPDFDDVVSVNYLPGSFLGGIIFSPPAGLTGTGEFEVTVQDDGGTENNGVDTFVATMTVIFTEPTTYAASLSSDGDENHIQPFTVDQSGPVLIENVDGNFDASFVLYEDRFDPLNTNSNQIESGRRITVDLEKDRQYILITVNEPIEDDLEVVAPPSQELEVMSENTLSFTNAIGTINGGVGFGFLPNLDFIEDVTIDEDESFTISLSGISDGNGGTDNLSLSGASQGIASFEFTDNLDGTAEALLNPVLNFDDNTSVTITVTGENGSTFDRTFELTINPINDAPVVATGNQQGDEETEFTFAAVANDVDSEDLTFSLDAASLNLGMSINAETGVFSWTTTETEDGNYSVTITASDGSLEDSETITVTINEVNQAPVLGGISNQVGAENSPLTFTASATDADLPANTLTFSLDANAASNGMSINASTGVFSWTPTNAQAGTYSVEVLVSDGSLSDSETITITIEDVLGISERAIEVYPNPTADYLYIRSTEVELVEIFDLNGAKVIDTKATTEIDLSSLKVGTYILKLMDRSGSVLSTDRIIKGN